MTSPTAGDNRPEDHPATPAEEHAMPYENGPAGATPTGDTPSWADAQRYEPAGPAPQETRQFQTPQYEPASAPQDEPAAGSRRYEPPTGAPQFALPYEDPFAGSGVGPDAPPPAVAARARGRRRMSALLALALLGAGGAGGVAGALVERDSSNNAAATSVSNSVTRTTSTVSSPANVAGSPESAAATIGPSVVTIAVTGTQSGTSRFGQTASQSVSDTGSGVVIRADGYILTNNHVVAAAASGGSVSVTFSDGKTVPATIVGTDATSDLAVIKASNSTGLTVGLFANSDALRVGQAVLAVGAPLGLSNTVTEGIVSTLHRPVRTGEQGASQQSVIDAVQTDAAINPGNSGGALVDLAGHVVGINSAIATTGSSTSGTSGNIGVGFAIPANSAATIANELIANGKATHPQLGVNATDATSTTNGTPGLGAGVAQASGAAAAAGLQTGDVITKIDDRQITDADSLIVAVRSHNPGEVVTITYTRNGATATTKATLGTAG